jgi:hypothetical protein
VGQGLPTRQRNPRYVVLAVVLILAGAVVGFWLYSRAGAKEPAVVVTHRIAAGHTIHRKDLSTVPVSGQVIALAGAHLPQAVGKTTTVGITPGTLLQRNMFTNQPPLAAGQAELAVSLAPGQYPPGLQAGDRVVVLGLPGKNSGQASSTQAPVLATNAGVFATGRDPSQTGGAVVTLRLAQSTAGKVAAADAANGVALVKVPR